MDFFAFAPRVFNFSVLPIIFPAPWTIYSSRRHRSLHLAKLVANRVRGAAEVADMYPAELSGGMQARWLGAGDYRRAKDYIFDEPDNGLDPIMSGVINKLIRELVTELG